jgi:tetrahydromethanopterin S-methyltransferase subunit G
MGEAAVELGEKELEKIGSYVKSHLPEWMGKIRRERELDLIERIVRVEEELKSLKEVTEARFEEIHERFEAVDKRFELMMNYMEKRFEGVNERFEAVDKRFELMMNYMEKRFEGVDKRFEAVDKRFDDMNHRFTQVQWMMGLGFTVLAALMGVFNFF